MLCLPLELSQAAIVIPHLVAPLHGLHNPPLNTNERPIQHPSVWPMRTHCVSTMSTLNIWSAFREPVICQGGICVLECVKWAQPASSSTLSFHGCSQRLLHLVLISRSLPYSSPSHFSTVPFVGLLVYCRVGASLMPGFLWWHTWYISNSSSKLCGGLPVVHNWVMTSW